jgi:hypothetical protein
MSGGLFTQIIIHMIILKKIQLIYGCIYMRTYMLIIKNIIL